MVFPEGMTYTKYRRKCANEEMLFDLREEFSLWGYTHHDLAAYIIQRFGFGLAAANGLAADSTESEGYSEEEKKWTFVRDYVSQLFIREVTGKELLEGPLHADATMVSKLTEATPEILQKAEQNSAWLTARKSSIDPEMLKVLKAPERP